MSEPKPRTSLEFLEHLLEVGEWYGSAIELDPYAPHHSDGEALKREAREIVERERLAGAEVASAEKQPEPERPLTEQEVRDFAEEWNRTIEEMRASCERRSEAFRQSGGTGLAGEISDVTVHPHCMQAGEVQRLFDAEPQLDRRLPRCLR